MIRSIVLIHNLMCSRPDFTDKRGKDDWKCPVAHVVRLPQLSRDEDLIGGGGLLREDNIAQVHNKTH